MSEDNIKWIMDTMREVNLQVLSLSKITASHAMALKILGAVLTLLGTGLVALGVEVLKK